MSKNKSKKFFKSLALGLGALLLCTTGVYAGGSAFDNYFYGDTVVNQVNDTQEVSENLGAVSAVGGVCNGSEPTTQLCNVNVYEIEAQTAITAADVTISDDLTVADDATISGELAYKEANTSLTATTTLTIAQSGNTFYINMATGTPITLPIATSSEGVIYRFVVADNFGTSNVVITSAEGDNIEGTLLVAGAVVDCDAEDFISFVADGENLGDYVELRSDGTQWLIGSSGALTSGKLTCTDPS